jgi:predicted GNAT family acetyltransferase
MRVHLTDDLAEYDAAVGDFLAADPVAHTVLLTILTTLRHGGRYDEKNAPWFGWAVHEGRVVGAVSRTPPHLVAVSDMPDEAAEALGAALADRDLPGATGPPALVSAFARGAGRTHETRIHELQYVLREVLRPTAVTGRSRPFEPSDTALFVAWMDAFYAEAGVLVRTDPLRWLEHRLAGGGALTLWCIGDEPVCMVGNSAPVGGVPRLGPVWTPVPLRGRGYAAALTAQVCSTLLAAGAVACTLYADEQNATANGVYRRIGFTPVGAAIEAVFRAS